MHLLDWRVNSLPLNHLKSPRVAPSLAAVPLGLPSSELTRHLYLVDCHPVPHVNSAAHSWNWILPGKSDLEHPRICGPSSCLQGARDPIQEDGSHSRQLWIPPWEPLGGPAAAGISSPASWFFEGEFVLGDGQSGSGPRLGERGSQALLWL